MPSLKEAEESGRAIAERFRETCPNLTAYFPQPSDENEFHNMLNAVEAFTLATSPANVLTYRLFARGVVNAVQSNLFKFRNWAPESAAAKEFEQLQSEATLPLPFDPDPETAPEVETSIRMVFKNFKS